MMVRSEVYREIMLNQLDYLPIDYNWRVIVIIKSIKLPNILEVTDQTMEGESFVFTLPDELVSGRYLHELPEGQVIRIFGRKVANGYEIHHLEPMDVDIEKYYTLRVLETRSSF